ncbi:MAG TPA: methyl-accepting chemotaxis protein [Gammaproteobacteria bacterium]|nr:methyl-accepting chemotaxis protein [Gammaproteobacteria bacterium]
MKNLSVKMRLNATLAVAILLLVGIGIMGIVGLGIIKEELRTVYEDRTVPLDQLRNIGRLLQENINLVTHSTMNEDSQAARRAMDEMDGNIALITRTWEIYMSTYLTPEEARLAEDFARTRGMFVQQGLRPAQELLRAGRFEESRIHINTNIARLFAPVGEGIEALLKLQIDVAAQEYANATELYQNMRLYAILAIVIGVAFVLWMAWMLVRAIMVPLEQAVTVANRIAEGELDNRIEIERNDELGKLLGALRNMTEKLSGIVGDVRTASDAVGSSAREIASGNDDLSQRTQEQASALEESASSMEEMTSTVKQNADNARQANQLAMGARDQAEQGGQVVSKAVAAMNEINASSRKIADIISVIDEIAFQTNLLALNAAVEAARAGEQGRGFAVVAAEVRNLAQRSAGAAKEIKDLIQDSVEKVKTGSGLVDESGKTLTEIVDSVKKVTDIVAEIAAASQEQSVGIEQVNKAITQMDEVTQQNAALVEEAAAASRSMEDQARRLVETMGFFRVGAAVAKSATLAPAPVAPVAKPAAKPAARPQAASRPAPQAARRPVVESDEWQEF